MGYIYKITNILDGKIYIGKTTKTIDKRFKGHCDNAKKYLTSDKTHIKNSKLYSAMNKYGIENFLIEEIEECSNDIIDQREIYWIDKLNARDRNIGYNIAKGGTGGDILSNLPEDKLNECKRKMSESRKGRVVSEETKNKIRQKLKGKFYLSPESKKKVVDNLLSIKPTPESLKRRSESLKKFYKEHPDFAKEKGKKISATKKGHVVISAEQREQTRNTLKEYYKTHIGTYTGKHHSDETKKQLSEIHKGRKHIIKGELHKVVKQDELENYLNDGWVLGSDVHHYKRVMCKNDNLEFNSVNEVIKYYGFNITGEKLRRYIIDKKPVNNYYFEYIKKQLV